MALALWACSSAQVQAEVLASTLSSPGAAQINKSGGAAASFDAVMFDLKGATAAVESVSFSMKDNVTPSTVWIAAIFSSHLTNTAPTTFVQDLGKATSSTSFAKTTFTPANPIALANNQRYWVVYGNSTTYQGAYQQTTTPSNSVSGSPLSVFISAAISTGMVARFRTPNQNTIVDTLSGITLTGGSTTTASAPFFEVTGTQWPTLVVLYDFYLQTVNGRVSLNWRTASEEDTVGFDLFRWDGGAWIKVNGTLVPGSGEMGGTYAVVDAAANATDTFRYKLVEYETDGGVQEYGPYEVAACNPRLENLTAAPEGVVVRWLSREGDVYTVQKARKAGDRFEAVATGLQAMPPVNAYTDRTERANSAFYRVVAE